MHGFFSASYVGTCRKRTGPMRLFSLGRMTCTVVNHRRRRRRRRRRRGSTTTAAAATATTSRGCCGGNDRCNHISISSSRISINGSIIIKISGWINGKYNFI